jgi:cardiolipin synthase
MRSDARARIPVDGPVDCQDGQGSRIAVAVPLHYRSEQRAMTIPNLITIARLIIVPIVIVAIVQGDWATAFLLFVIAGLSDGIDGFIARRFDMRSEFGAYIDPLADKALLVSIFVTLAVVGVLPGWIAIVVVSRDLMIVSAIVLSWVMNRPVEIKPLLVSKLNTAAQIGFAALILSTKAFGVDLHGFGYAAMTLVAILTVASAAAYLAGWLRHMAA